MKQRRGVGFVIIAAVYAAAIAFGIFLYRVLPGAYWLKLLLAAIVSTVFVFGCSTIFRNASVYDPYWSVQPIVILTGFALMYGLTPIGAVLNTLMFLFISIPMADRHQARKPDFDAYKAETHALRIL